MSTYVFMKILESTPNRYDRGIRLLTLGRLDDTYNRLTSYVKQGHTVLDIGCGTGALTLRAARRGARVKGIDINPQMLEIAQRLVDEEGFTDNVELCEMGVAELGSEARQSFDVVMSCLCFSELTDDEVSYALAQAKELLKDGGLFLIADETRPPGLGARVLNWSVRAPVKLITYVLTQATTSAVEDLPEKVEKAGLHVEKIKLNRMGNFIELVAKRGRAG